MTEEKKENLLDVIARHNGNKLATARELGVTESTIYVRLKKKNYVLKFKQSRYSAKNLDINLKDIPYEVKVVMRLIKQLETLIPKMKKFDELISNSTWHRVNPEKANAKAIKHLRKKEEEKRIAEQGELREAYLESERKYKSGLLK